MHIDIAYGGSCTAGKGDDLDMYARVMRERRGAGRRVADGVEFYIQFGSQAVEEYAQGQGLPRPVRADRRPGHPARLRRLHRLRARRLANATDQVTVSAINRNYQGRSGPGSSTSPRR